jgi:hypothetical protein
MIKKSMIPRLSTMHEVQENSKRRIGNAKKLLIIRLCLLCCSPTLSKLLKLERYLQALEGKKAY